MGIAAKKSTSPAPQSANLQNMPRPRRKTPVAGIKIVRSKGRVYHYHRATGKRIKSDPNTSAFHIEVNALDERAAADAAVARGSLAEIVAAYKAPDAGRAGRTLPFKKLKDRTRRDYQECFEYLEPTAAKLFPSQMKPRHVQALVDDAADVYGWAFGDKLLSVVRLVINWGRYHELTSFKDHPCANVLAPARNEDAPESNRPWTDAERVAVFNEAPPEGVILFGLCLYAQLNIAHAIDIPVTAIKIERKPDGSIQRRLKWRRAKNGHAIDVAIEGPLALIVDACSKVGPTLATNSRGNPWTKSAADSMRDRVLKKLVDAGKVEPGLTFHGLRSTLGAVAAEGGASDKQIAAAIHDGTSEMGALYSRSANSRKLADVARNALIERDQTLVSGILRDRLENRMENARKVVAIAPPKA